MEQLRKRRWLAGILMVLALGGVACTVDANDDDGADVEGQLDEDEVETDEDDAETEVEVDADTEEDTE